MNEGPRNSSRPTPATRILRWKRAQSVVHGASPVPASVEQLASGCRWAEGPAVAITGAPPWSDIPNDHPAVGRRVGFGYQRLPVAVEQRENGLARDRQGRLLTRASHAAADAHRAGWRDHRPGGRLLRASGSLRPTTSSARATATSGSRIPAGIHGWWEGAPAAQELPHAWVSSRRRHRRLQCVIDDLAAPNGIALLAGRVLRSTWSRVARRRAGLIWAWDVGVGGQLSNRRRHVDAEGAGALDGMAVDADGTPVRVRGATVVRMPRRKTGWRAGVRS